MPRALEDILATVKLKSAIYFNHGFEGPWGMSVPQGSYAQFHLITGGSCVLEYDAGQHRLEKGDVVIFPRGNHHDLKAKPECICRPGSEILAEILDGPSPSGEELSTQLICGHFEFNRDLSHPIFDTLPSVIVIKSNEYGRFELIHSVLELIIDELSRMEIGHEMVALRLAEVLFISIIRHYFLRQDSSASNILKDKVVHKAVDLFHGNLSRDWQLDDLSKELGISRTLFISRFKKATGITPIKYLSNWRMEKAKYYLSSTDLPQYEIGYLVGYPSEPSFSRVFKQKVGMSPSRYRKSRALASQ